MKNIKNLIKTLFLLPIAVLVGCDNDYEAPASFTDLSITWTTTGTDRVSQVDQYYSFMDLSAGAEYQEWRIPENTFFLKGPIPNNLKKHDAYIKQPIETTSTDKTVHVLFKKGNSDTRVGYYGVFKDSTSFRFNLYWDATINSAVEDTIKTVNINGKWIAEYYFTLDVYDTVVASPQVRELDGTIIDHLNTASKTITFGDKLVFEDLSAFVADNNARPEETRWRVRSIEPNVEDRKTIYTGEFSRDGDFDKRILDTITFNKLGEYRVELKATRERTEDLKVSEDTINMPMVFKVVPLAQDLTRVASIAIEELADDRIVIPISSPLAALTGNVAADFTVKVDGATIPVETVTIGTRKVNGVTVGGLLYLTLDANLEPEDAAKTVTVSYSGTTIKSQDERVLKSFTDAAIVVYVPTPINKIGTVKEADNDEILIRFDQAIDPESIANSANPTVGFIATLNGAPFNVASISVDLADPKMLRIAMSDMLYQDDDITIAYTGPGAVRSVGGGAIANFTAVTIEPFFENLLTIDNGFEGTLGDYWVEGAGLDGATVQFTTEQAFEGNQSAKLTALRPRLESGATLNYEGGQTYIVSFRRYILSTSVTLDDAFHQLDHGDKIWLDSGDGGSATTPRWYGEAYPAGTPPALDTWELVEAEQFMAADAFNKKIRIQPVPTADTDFTVYYDDFKIYKKDFRP